MPMRICGVCHRLSREGPVHAACRKPRAYTSYLHRFVGQMYRNKNVPCTECGTRGTPENPIEAHHVVPLDRGGTDVIENYEPMCRLCNAKRGSRTGTE